MGTKTKVEKSPLEASVYRLPSGKWRARRSVGPRGRAATYSATGSSPDEARVKLANKMAVYRTGIRSLSVEKQLVMREDELAVLYRRVAELEAELDIERGRRFVVAETVRAAVLKRDQGRCRYCGEPTDKPHLDHYVPRILGGTGTYENLVTACGPCNRRKGQTAPHELAGRGMRLLPVPTG